MCKHIHQLLQCNITNGESVPYPLVHFKLPSWSVVLYISLTLPCYNYWQRVHNFVIIITKDMGNGSVQDYIAGQVLHQLRMRVLKQ